jgi:outer membrane receptor for ferrienterochelin and colicins
LRSIFLFAFLILITFLGRSQNGNISGVVMFQNEAMPYVNVQVKNGSNGAITDENGLFAVSNIPFGSYELVVSLMGFETQNIAVKVSKAQPSPQIEVVMKEKMMDLETVVVTGFKTPVRQTDAPIIVNVLNNKTLENTQSCNLSEGLKFQPGLRVETDCQTCNYTQLRMNGLPGGYSQILINGRPIFSPLTGLYGMEQLPVNLIDRVEVIRGGGSSIYGPSAIGGTVNVITKIPRKNSYELGYTYQNINTQSSDHQFIGSATKVSPSKKSGISLMGNYRNREYYDHNGDYFSELPKIENVSLGASGFVLPQENQKLEFSLLRLHEYRKGGEMVDEPAHRNQQSEERTQNVWMYGADYQINFNKEQSSFIAYLAGQTTNRSHYTGIFPDEPEEIIEHLANPPYGESHVQTFNTGVQVNHKVNKFFTGANVFTFGSELVYDDVFDEIEAYQYVVDQTTQDFGIFGQSDWAISPKLTLLAGLRMDHHNLIENPIFSYRTALMYKTKNKMQFRGSFGTGFRPPQAFDADMHIAFAGGGVSRISLSPVLKPETSQSFSGSVNYDKPTAHYIWGFTLEGFYTRLKDAFVLVPIGQDINGELFEKQNGQGATVSGITVELRANFDKKFQVESGFTVQSSMYDSAVTYISGVDPIREFVRTPNVYGFANLTVTPHRKISANLNYVYTGPMFVPHFAGAPNQAQDEMSISPRFSELNCRFSYLVEFSKKKSGIEWFCGVKNIFNAYQSDFDTGKNRDSNFIYGPAQPRTFFVGVKWKSA